MAASEPEVKRAAELKLWLETRIAELQDEIGRLREALTLVDANLRASTYKPAIELMDRTSPEAVETREIKRDKGGAVVAKASITADRLQVETLPGVPLRPDVPPFKTFLVNKILQGMKTKDEELVAKGKLESSKALRYSFEEKGGQLTKLTIENYREKSRLNEILSTISWTLSRMLEK
jgi:hypothetical protein